MTPREEQIKDLRVKLFGLLSRQTSDAEFVQWLSAYASRGQEILAPRDALDAEFARKTSNREWGRWANDQKVVDFVHEHKLVLDKSSIWWWIRDQRFGEIDGLPGSRGIERITNGIDVWIERGDGTLFKGHKDWWKPDETEAEKSTEKSTKKYVLDEDDLKMLDVFIK